MKTRSILLSFGKHGLAGRARRGFDRMDIPLTAIIPSKRKPNPDSDSAALSPRKRFLRRSLTFLGILTITGILFAPLFVAKSPLRHRILPMLLPDYPAKITTGQATLFWWSSVELGDVQFEDTAGKPLLHIEKITSEKSLIALLADQIRVGGFRIERPHLIVQLQEGGSNLEKTIAPVLAPSEDSEGLDIKFQVRDGVIEIRDPQTQRKTELKDVQADIHLPLDSAEALTARGAVRVQNAEANGNAGKIDFDASYRWLTENTPPRQSGTLRLKTSDLRMHALAAAFARLDPQLDITGVLVSDLSAEWTTGDEVLLFKLGGGLNATNFSLAAPAWLGQDRFRLEYLTHRGQIEYELGELHLTEWKLQSDVLTCDAHGKLNLPELLKVGNGPTSEIPVEDFHVSGEINVARIAKMLPQTLRLRDGLEIQTGKVLLALDTNTQNAEQQLTGKISTSKIAAVADGQTIIWDRPLEVTLKARNTATGPVLDELLCRADFLSLWAQGTPDNATFKAACKLDELMKELNRFADLEAWQLAGRIDAGLTVRRLNSELIRGAASAVVKNFRFQPLTDPPTTAWEETELVLAAGGDVFLQPDQRRELQNLSVQLKAGGDELKVVQTQPMKWTGEFPELAMTAELRGDLQNWRNRLRPFVSTEGWQVGGTIVANAQAYVSPERMKIERATADLQDLHLIGTGVNLSESRVRVQTQAEWTAKTGQLQLPTTTWASPSLSLRADGIEYRTTPEGTPRTSGQVVFRGSAGVLSRWFQLKDLLGPEMDVVGTASGQIDLTMTDQAADANWNLVIDDAFLTQLVKIEPPPGLAFRPVTDPQTTRRETVWSEKRIACRGGGMYEFTRDQLTLRPTLVEAPWVSVTASGSVGQLTTRGEANLTGSLTCNLPLLAERYRSSLGNDIQIVGNETRPLTIRGPLWGAEGNQRVANDLTAFASLPWQRMDVYGLPVGPSELRADLNAGTVQIGPVDAALGTGRLKLKSKLPLNAPVLALQVEQGPILENVRITPELSRRWLKYAVPYLADSTETDGQFSAFITKEGLIPLDNPNLANASGVLAIESAQMRPGKLVTSLSDVTKQIKSLIRGQAAGGVMQADAALIRLEKQNLNVQCVNGRIYHQNLKMVLTGIPITTTGSVGFDETLSLIAEIPIQPDWLTQNRLMAGLKGQTLKIPIGGTLSQPQLDTRAVFTAIRQAAQNATGRVINNEIQDQIQRLFK